MSKVLVSVTRVSYYEVEVLGTDAEEHAIDRVLDGEIEEAWGETTTVVATEQKGDAR
jgi:hypothetical protein